MVAIFEEAHLVEWEVGLPRPPVLVAVLLELVIEEICEHHDTLLVLFDVDDLQKLVDKEFVVDEHSEYIGELIISSIKVEERCLECLVGEDVDEVE